MIEQKFLILITSNVPIIEFLGLRLDDRSLSAFDKHRAIFLDTMATDIQFLCHLGKELLFSNKETTTLFSLVSNRTHVLNFVECFWGLPFGAYSASGPVGLCLLPSLKVSTIVSDCFSPMGFPHPNCLETPYCWQGKE